MTPSLFDVDELANQLSSSGAIPAPCAEASITYIAGDATLPRLTGKDALVHVVNDRAVIWGAGFGKAVRHRWPQAQSQFRSWVRLYPHMLRLGQIHTCAIRPDFSIIQLIAQHGYGPSDLPRIRYEALQTCLAKLAAVAQASGMVLHMPRIGCGEAGGEWTKIEQLIRNSLCAGGISVIVYTLPRKRLRKGGE